MLLFFVFCILFIVERAKCIVLKPETLAPSKESVHIPSSALEMRWIAAVCVRDVHNSIQPYRQPMSRVDTG